MPTRMNRLHYFTIEDESMLAEAFPRFEHDGLAIAYKVVGSDDVFVTTGETREAMDRHDVPHTVLAEESGDRIAIHHSALSKEELGDFEPALKALALAYRAIALACVGVNGETDLGFDLSEGVGKYTYFTAPAGHTFIFRLFGTRTEAETFLDRLLVGDKDAISWARAIPLESSDELVGYH